MEKEYEGSDKETFNYSDDEEADVSLMLSSTNEPDPAFSNFSCPEHPDGCGWR